MSDQTRERQIRAWYKGGSPMIMWLPEAVGFLLGELDAARQRQWELEQALAEALDGWEYAARNEFEKYEQIATLRTLLTYDEVEPEWFPNEGDRQWWREKHSLRQSALARQDGPQETT